MQWQCTGWSSPRNCKRCLARRTAGAGKVTNPSEHRVIDARPILLAIAWLALSSLIASADGASAAELSATDRDAIRHVITQQLEAFQRDDGVEAFSYASPAIQAQFETPAAFMSMVRNAYEAVYRPRSTHFLDALVVDGRVAQPVRVVGPDGDALVAHYLMERQPDGTWRISGCVLGKPPGEAA